MKHILPFLFALMSSSVLFGQIDYNFSTYETDFAYLENATEAVTESWDDPNATIPLGFDFTCMGTTTSDIHLLNDFLGGTIVLDPFNTSWDMIWVTSTDLIDAGYANDEHISTISYLTEGEPGTRIFKLEWKNCGNYNEYADVETANNLISLQLWLYEGSNDIEVHWGPNTIKETQYFLDDWFSSGLLNDATQNNEFNYGKFLGGTADSPNVFEGNTTDVFFLATMVNIPSNGRVYRWSTEPVSVQETSAIEWQVFPTTTSNELNFRVSEKETCTYTILNLGGQIIAQGNFMEYESVSMANQANGIYLVRLEAADSVKTFKIIKQ